MSFVRKRKVKDRIYLEEVENQWINGKVVQRHIRYIGRQADGQTILSSSLSHAQVEAVKIYGPLLALNHLAQEIHLSDHLGEYASEILSMVYAHCLNPKSINQMAQWFERTDLNLLLDLEELTEKRLLNALDSLEKQDSDKLQRNIFEAIQKRYRVKSSGLVYDVTNTYLYGKKCPLGKLGHDKEGVLGRPLIQIGLAATKEEGFPVFHKVFDGNIHDSKTLQDMIFSLVQYKMEPGLLIYDRGITSKRNISEVKSLKWDTLCGMALNKSLKRVWSSVINRSDLVQFKNRIRLKKTVFYVTTRPYTVDGVRGELALCFNEQLQHDIRESRYDEIVNARELLGKGKAIKPGLKKFFDKKGNVIRSRLAEAERFDGYSCLFCTCRLPKEDMVRFYFDKDLIEKAFRSLKGIVGLQPVRHWLYRRVVAHVFICYLAYLLLSLLQWHVKKLGITAEEALRELETMYKVYLKDSKKGFRLSRTVMLSKKQEAMLRAVSRKLVASPSG